MIVGAGLAGLITAHVFQRQMIVEAAPEPVQNHRALLRFRTDGISKLTGVPFREVRVRKAIYHEGKERAPGIGLANLYTQKCLGSMYGERSIWHIEPVTRYVAPETFHEELVENLSGRIHWGTPIDFADDQRGEPLISTVPLDVVCDALNIHTNLEFNRAPITVMRYRVPRADVFQTIYFPSNSHSLYRASITGDLLICEFAQGEVYGPWQSVLEDAFKFVGSPELIDNVDQKYGKIAPIDDAARKQIVAQLTNDFNIFSIGRFATWRNLLLDDVLDDTAVIKRLLHASAYERRLAAL